MFFDMTNSASVARMDNTGLISPFPGGMPPRMAGLRGIGEADNPLLDPATIQAANSELVFLTNWWRATNNQKPLSMAASAPAMNFGLTPETQQLLLLAGAAILAVVLLKKKRR